MKTNIIENLSRLASANQTACPRTLDEYFSKKNKGQVVEEIAGMFNTAIKRNPTLSGALGESDLQSIIQLVWKENPAFGRNTVKELFGEMYPITTRELINIEENYSGVRLIHRLRKFIPTVPPYAVINKEKKVFNTEFEALLKPHRIPSGWAIDVDCLLKLLRFRYPYVSNRHIRIYGDARVIGGRTSTVLNLSFVNHELLLNGEAFQNPKGMYSFAIFYESDSSVCPCWEYGQELG